MATLVEIGDLVRTRPTADASSAELAAWYERKAVMLRHESLVDLAEQAHTRAVLLAGGEQW